MLLLRHFNETLAGWPDGLLTVLVLFVGVLFIVAALFGPPVLKVGALGVVVF